MPIYFWIFTAATSLIGILLSIIATVLIKMPSVAPLAGCLTTSMNNVYLCPGSTEYSNIKEISPFLKNAILLSEDASFYGHNGFDLFEIKESFIKNISKGKLARGGSTITQQLTKNVFLTPQKTFTRKFKEAVLTYQIEKTFTKDEILERYLNLIELGEDIYGVKQAADFYFGKTPHSLNLLESAYLAYLLPSPEKYSKTFENGELTEFARNRVTSILSLMVRFERITQEEYDASMSYVDDFPWKGINLPPYGHYETRTPPPSNEDENVQKSL